MAQGIFKDESPNAYLSNNHLRLSIKKQLNLRFNRFITTSKIT
ncbi:hypothetical protein PALI_a3248 [Pseudoalteromonas aliena SW19]|uniref:Transposase n=1 Tax=Pseudoalteromonas aliena SW19 TaxID=1314866 RepID=A0ABR9DUK7_9GAMM|nr:hypothetical protein [Pseudoalteromonas aliena SW19]